MVHIATIIDPREITRQFAKAVQKKDFTIIENLLADNGEFNTEDADLNTIDSSSKSVFMDWLKFVLTEQTVTSSYETKIHYKVHCGHKDFALSQSV
ncbi:MAG: hypothetical protein K9G49_11185 [Taibaiella sp.]|nr:hypothetical protein [Taibaiella sp.]